MFSRFQAFHFGMNIYEKSTLEQECVRRWIFSRIWLHFGTFFSQKSIKKRCKKLIKFWMLFWKEKKRLKRSQWERLAAGRGTVEGKYWPETVLKSLKHAQHPAVGRGRRI